MNYGTLYGVGVGPGAPDLITLRALNVLKQAQVIALPRSSDYGESMAWKILKPTLGDIPGQERIFLTFPMNKDPERLKPAWDAALLPSGSGWRKACRSPLRRKEIPRSLVPSFICAGKLRCAGLVFVSKLSLVSPRSWLCRP